MIYDNVITIPWLYYIYLYIAILTTMTLYLYVAWQLSNMILKSTGQVFSHACVKTAMHYLPYNQTAWLVLTRSLSRWLFIMCWQYSLLQLIDTYVVTHHYGLPSAYTTVTIYLALLQNNPDKLCLLI